MPSALDNPPGYADTGTTASFTLSGSVALNASGNSSAVTIGLHGSLAVGQKWTLYEVYYQSGPNFISELWLRSPLGDPFTGFPPLPVMLQTINHGVSPPPANTFFAPEAFSATLGPSRLGARFDIPAIVGPADTPVGLADENALVLAWFESEASQFNETVGGVNETVYSLAALGAPGTDCSRIINGPAGMFLAGGGPSPPGVGVAIAHFTAVTINGSLLDTDGIDLAPALAGSYLAVAAGAFDITDLTSAGFELSAAPGASITFANSAVDYAGAGVTPDLFDNWLTVVDLFRGVPRTPQQTFVSNGTFTGPFVTNYPRATKDPPAFSALSIDPAYPAANGWDGNDLAIVLDQHSPISAALTYTPVKVTHKGAIEVDRPGGVRPSSWAINSGANGSVTNGATTTDFVVTNTAARFTRDFATNWRNYVTGYPFNPEFDVEGYSFLKAGYGQGVRSIAQVTYPEDIWWWNSYMFLRLNITATGAAELTLTVQGIDLGVSDSHDGATISRAAALGFTYANETRVYTVTLANGTADYWIDLSFPHAYVSESGAPFPMRRPRVDSIEVAFSATGTFNLNACELSRRDLYPNQTSVAYSPQSTYNGEWPAIYLRVDGEATPILTYPDSFRKGMESEVGEGGAVRFAEPIDASGSVLTAHDMWQTLARIEGFDVVYTDATRAAFHDDSFGVSIVTAGNEPSQFAQEVTPGVDWVGVGNAHNHQPLHAIRCGALQFPNGLTVTVRGRHVFGGGVEAVAMAGGLRAGAGVNFNLFDQVNTLLATVATDTRGRLHFEPIGDGETVRFVAV